MKFYIDTKYLKEYDIGFDSLLILLSIYFNKPLKVIKFPEDIEGYCLRNEDLNKYYLSQRGVNLVEDIFLKSEFTDKSVNISIEELAEKLREIYPKGKKPGTAYMWRDSTALIVKRLKAFFKKYGKFDDEAIIDVTKKYVESFNGNYTYMQLLKYFIFKDEESQLLSYLSNPEDIDNDNNDWQSILK